MPSARRRQTTPRRSAGRAGLADAKRAALAVPAVVVGVVVLGLAEIGQHVLVGPAGAAQLAPFVIVQRVAARVDLRVDRRPAADHPWPACSGSPCRSCGAAARSASPRADALGHLREACGQVIERMPVAAPGFQQQDAGRRVFGQPRGKHLRDAVPPIWAAAQHDDDAQSVEVLRRDLQHVAAVSEHSAPGPSTGPMSVVTASERRGRGRYPPDRAGNDARRPEVRQRRPPPRRPARPATPAPAASPPPPERGQCRGRCLAGRR
jgi:hypothetical protein